MSGNTAIELIEQFVREVAGIEDIEAYKPDGSGAVVLYRIKSATPKHLKIQEYLKKQQEFLSLLPPTPGSTLPESEQIRQMPLSIVHLAIIMDRPDVLQAILEQRDFMSRNLWEYAGDVRSRRRDNLGGFLILNLMSNYENKWLAQIQWLAENIDYLEMRGVISFQAGLLGAEVLAKILAMPRVKSFPALIIKFIEAKKTLSNTEVIDILIKFQDNEDVIKKAIEKYLQSRTSPGYIEREQTVEIFLLLMRAGLTDLAKSFETSSSAYSFINTEPNSLNVAISLCENPEITDELLGYIKRNFWRKQQKKTKTYKYRALERLGLHWIAKSGRKQQISESESPEIYVPGDWVVMAVFNKNFYLASKLLEMTSSKYRYGYSKYDIKRIVYNLVINYCEESANIMMYLIKYHKYALDDIGMAIIDMVNKPRENTVNNTIKIPKEFDAVPNIMKLFEEAEGLQLRGTCLAIFAMHSKKLGERSIGEQLGAFASNPVAFDKLLQTLEAIEKDNISKKEPNKELFTFVYNLVISWYESVIGQLFDPNRPRPISFSDTEKESLRVILKHFDWLRCTRDHLETLTGLIAKDNFGEKDREVYLKSFEQSDQDVSFMQKVRDKPAIMEVFVDGADEKLGAAGTLEGFDKAIAYMKSLIEAGEVPQTGKKIDLS